MSEHAERLNTWHLELAILADAIGHTLQGIEEPEGLSATAYVLRTRLDQMVESCPFPGQGRICCDSHMIRPVDPEFDLADFDGSLPVDAEGVPAELLTGGRHD